MLPPVAPGRGFGRDGAVASAPGISPGAFTIGVAGYVFFGGDLSVPCKGLYIAIVAFAAPSSFAGPTPGQ